MEKQDLNLDETMETTSEEDDEEDESDLIDLENHDSASCMRIATVSGSTTIVDEEHLLDVYPPQLEEKLSFTVRKEEKIAKEEENEDVLVTLGHDQMVPICKRIDIVSTDTIKRVRDITKNLEPVIRTRSVPLYNSRDKVDSISKNLEDETTETREINNAFNFLTDLDDELSSNENQRKRLDSIDEHVACSRKMLRRRSSHPGFNFDRESHESKRTTLPRIDGSIYDDEARSLSCKKASPWTESDDHSESSEVDWSWLEEVEETRKNREELVENEQEERTASTSISDSIVEDRGRRRIRERQTNQPNISNAMSVDATGKTSQLCRDAIVHDNNERSSIGWLRSSMRRLRHLRLPENHLSEQQINSSPIVSGPNSLPDIALIAPEILAAQTNSSTTERNDNNRLRPSSAPIRSFGVPNRSSTSSRRDAARSYCGGRRVGSATRDNSVQEDRCSHPRVLDTATRRIYEEQRETNRGGRTAQETNNSMNEWPHALSSVLACLSCTLGLFNINRFAILSIQFGANFIVQFLILSLVLGIPLFTLQVCLGQRLTAGPMDMWKISPLFQGVGIALLIAQAFIGIYSIIGVSWMFVYFRDSFITREEKYRWTEPSFLYKDDRRLIHNTSRAYNLLETVPDYFNEAVLQRYRPNESEPGVVTLKFQVAFNLAIVWMIIFVCLSKGLRSYGKVVYVFTLLPVCGTLILCTKLLGYTPPGSTDQFFSATVWPEFFINSKSWMAASSEVFLTWGLLGAAVMQITAHNKHKHLLQRETSLVILSTLMILLLVAFLANTCVQILKYHDYIYISSTFEKISSYAFMRVMDEPIHQSTYNTAPERFRPHASFIVGERVQRPATDSTIESGYQVLRFSTELIPTTLALLGPGHVSAFWTILFYFSLICFGIAQQLAIWHCVITGVMAINKETLKLWETTITFFSCVCAYALGLPMATELGIHVVYYLDYIIGGAWWIMVLYLIQVGAIFAIRGRPYTGDDIVTELFPTTGRYLRHWAAPLLSFTWNVILPVILMILSISVFKNAGFKELYSYRRTSKDYWTIGARRVGAAIQLIPILIVPLVAFIQTCRYLNNGPPDILDRIQLLYRPSIESRNSRDSQNRTENNETNTEGSTGVISPSTELPPFEDPPPKYTPPPSYTTATGARIAKMLRQSFRRSVRRIASVLGESSGASSRPPIQPLPPDYASVLVEMNDVPQAIPDVVTGIRNEEACSSSSVASSLTAADVANLFRSSLRRGTGKTQTPRAASVENLVEAAAPIGQDSLIFRGKDQGQVSLVSNQLDQDHEDVKKTENEGENSVSVRPV